MDIRRMGWSGTPSSEGKMKAFVRGYVKNGMIVLVKDDGRSIEIRAPQSWEKVHPVPVHVPDHVTDCEPYDAA